MRITPAWRVSINLRKPRFDPRKGNDVENKLRKLVDVVEKPSAFDSWSNYMGDRPEDSWLCVMTQNRDADTLTRSNWVVACERLKEKDSENVEIFRFGHWACGWWEALAVREGTPEADEAQKIADKLEDYPILEEDHFSEMETKEADEVWKNCYGTKERLEYIREHRDQFEFHNFSELRAIVKGEYFNGYASELIS